MRPMNWPGQLLELLRKARTPSWLLAMPLLCAMALVTGCASISPGFRVQPVVVSCPDNLVYAGDRRLPSLPDPLDQAGLEEYSHRLLDRIDGNATEADRVAAECRGWLDKQRK